MSKSKVFKHLIYVSQLLKWFPNYAVFSSSKSLKNLWRFFKFYVPQLFKKRKRILEIDGILSICLFTFFSEIKSKDIRSPENRIKYPLSTMSAVKIPKLD